MDFVIYATENYKITLIYT